MVPRRVSRELCPEECGWTGAKGPIPVAFSTAGGASGSIRRTFPVLKGIPHVPHTPRDTGHGLSCGLEGHVASIAIAGGGIAGLACAGRLARAGHDVEVLEAADAPGGRVAGERRGPLRLEHGADVFGPRAIALRRRAAELGLAGGLRPWSHGPDALCTGGALHALGGARGWGRALARAARAGGARSLPHLLRGAAGALVSGGEAREDQTLGTWLGPRGAGEPLAAPLEPLLVAAAGAGVDALSAGAALRALRGLGVGAPLESFAEGADALPRAMAADLPVRLGCRVTAIETETDGARVRYTARGRESRVIADAVVVAVPGDRAAPLCVKLTPAERGFLEGVRYAPAIVVTLICDRAPRELLARRVWFDPAEGGVLAELRADHRRPGAAPLGMGLLRAVLTPEATRRLWDASDAAVADAVFEQLAYGPLGAVAPRDFAVRRWPSAHPVCAPGHVAARRRFASRVDRSPRLVFAGDYLGAEEGGGVEAALASGLRAADALIRRL